MTWGRAVLAVTVTVTALLSSCTVPEDGAVGLTVDDAGHPVGVLVTCEHPIDGVTLYSPDGPQHGDAPSAQYGRWELSAGPHAVRRWPLEQLTSGDGVKVLQSLRPLDAGREYSMYGWTYDNSWSTWSVGFVAADPISLRPGTFLFVDPTTGGRKKASLAEFRRRACARG